MPLGNDTDTAPTSQTETTQQTTAEEITEETVKTNLPDVKFIQHTPKHFEILYCIRSFVTLYSLTRV